MFTLIMSIIIRGKLTVTTISGFDSIEACRYAGAQQEVALRNDFKIQTDRYYTVVCINMKEPK